ncbi:MAG: DUF3054 domain-containing protein [Candidatus Dormiibacterota bacterium]
MAPVLDLVCLVGFVLGGRSAHDIGGGVTAVLIILWPLVVGWFSAAAAVRLYASSALPRWARLLLTWVLGLTVGLILRAAVTGRATPIPFLLVAFGFIGGTTAAWRLLGVAASRIQTG